MKIEQRPEDAHPMLLRLLILLAYFGIICQLSTISTLATLRTLLYLRVVQFGKPRVCHNCTASTGCVVG